PPHRRPIAHHRRPVNPPTSSPSPSTISTPPPCLAPTSPLINAQPSRADKGGRQSGRTPPPTYETTTVVVPSRSITAAVAVPSRLEARRHLRDPSPLSLVPARSKASRRHTSGSIIGDQSTRLAIVRPADQSR
ncbi:hypothetical protein Dimus_005698, partial [Dionaea muscipula]